MTGGPNSDKKLSRFPGRPNLWSAVSLLSPVAWGGLEDVQDEIRGLAGYLNRSRAEHDRRNVLAHHSDVPIRRRLIAAGRHGRNKTTVLGFDRRVVLAPACATREQLSIFPKLKSDASAHTALVTGLQRLRGRVYVEDNALPAGALDQEGRHRLSEDYRSWHLLTLNAEGEPRGCLRCLPSQPPVQFRNLAVYRSPLATSDSWGRLLREAVESEIARAHRRNALFFEVSGWAVDRSLRFTNESIWCVAGAYALAELLGGGIGIATATVRNRSSTILRRLGGTPLRLRNAELPRYYDARYGCEMEVLLFDTETLPRAFSHQVDLLRGALLLMPLFSPAPRAPGLFDHVDEYREPVGESGLNHL